MSQHELSWAVKNGDTEAVKQHFSTGINANTEIDGRPLLHYAADFGKLPMLQLLIENGANVNEADKYGNTALLNAIYEGHFDCVKYLLEKGADKTKKTSDGKAYHEVCENEEIKKLLK